MSPQVGTRLDKLISAPFLVGVIFKLLFGGGRGGNREVAYEQLDLGEGVAICKHLACLINKVLFWRYVVLKGEQKDEFPGLDQEQVDGGGEGGGDRGGS